MYFGECYTCSKIWSNVVRRQTAVVSEGFIRGFPTIDHSGKKINSAKKLPLTGIEPVTLGL